MSEIDKPKSSKEIPMDQHLGDFKDLQDLIEYIAEEKGETKEEFLRKNFLNNAKNKKFTLYNHLELELERIKKLVYFIEEIVPNRLEYSQHQKLSEIVLKNKKQLVDNLCSSLISSESQFQKNLAQIFNHVFSHKS